MNALRDLLILNLTLQVFDGLFSYQVFSLGAGRGQSNRGRCNIALGRDLRFAIQENFGLFSTARDFRIETPAHVARKTRDGLDCFGVHLRYSCVSLETFELGRSQFTSQPHSDNRATTKRVFGNFL